VIGSDLLRFSDRKIVIWDKESQRLNLLDDNLPFECAWVVMQRGQVLSRHAYYLGWPVDEYCRRMSPDAARFTRFQRAWVENGDDPEFVLEAFESYAMDPQYLLAGHNVLGFDAGLWQLWRRALGRPVDWSFQSRLIDSHLLARAYKEGWKPDRENLEAWQYKVSSSHRKGVKTKLDIMAKEFDIPVDESKRHGAVYDLELNAAVLWKLINLMEI
jgi:DNA polymerase III epsilon subunit-like protein